MDRETRNQIDKIADELQGKAKRLRELSETVREAIVERCLYWSPGNDRWHCSYIMCDEPIYKHYKMPSRPAFIKAPLDWIFYAPAYKKVSASGLDMDLWDCNGKLFCSPECVLAFLLRAEADEYDAILGLDDLKAAIREYDGTRWRGWGRTDIKPEDYA